MIILKKKGEYGCVHPIEKYTGFIRGILRGVRYAKSLRVLFLHRRSPSWTTLVLYSRAVFFFNEPTNILLFALYRIRYRKPNLLLLPNGASWINIWEPRCKKKKKDSPIHIFTLRRIHFDHRYADTVIHSYKDTVCS